MKITLRQLQVFVAIAKYNHMSRAAESLYLSQSACSMALTTLERQLGCELFDRYNKKLVLNDPGRELFYKAINLLQQATELVDSMQAKTKKSLSGSLNVGASTTIGNYILPVAAANFMNLHPQTRIFVKIANTEEIIQRLLDFQIDIGFIEGDCYHHDLEINPWRQDKLMIIAAPHHPLASQEKVTLEILQKQRWIFRELGSGTRQKFEEAIGRTITPFMELGHTEAIKQVVEAGIGVSCLSQAAVSKALKQRELVVIKTPFLKLTRNFYKIIHKQKYQTHLLAKFTEYLSRGH
ncbi:MAG: LysR family transcriptional regulator [Proteobacteria bacterium]|nr:LysR family transcriptional regulator [Pseudomonadota bacterium]